MCLRKICLLVAVSLAQGLCLTVDARTDLKSGLSVRQLFEQALEAGGNEYIDLRNAVVERKGAASFLKTRLSDQDWKTAILAQAMLERIKNPEKYARLERILIKAADGYFVSTAHIPEFRPAELGYEINERTIPFIVELAVKDSVAYVDYVQPDFAQEFAERYFADDLSWDEMGLYDWFMEDPNRNIRALEGLSLEERGRLRRYLLTRQRDERARFLFRRSAVLRLGRLSHPVVLPALAEVLRGDGWPEVRKYAAEGIKDPTGAVHLRAALKDKTPMVRSAAAKALGMLADAESVDALITALKDENRGVQEKAAVALGQIGDPRAVEPLIQTLKQLPEVAVATAIGKIDIEALLSLLDERVNDPNIHVVKVVRALGELKNPRAVYPLVLTLHDEDKKVRGFSAGALGKIGDRRAVKPLIHALHSDSFPDVRNSAAEALGKIKDPQAVEPLINALKDTAPYVRQNAAIALEKLGDPRALQALEATAAHDEDTSVRGFAQGAVREIKKKNRGKKPPEKSKEPPSSSQQ